MFRLALIPLITFFPDWVVADKLETYLTRPGSHAMITLELPFDVIHALIEAEIDERFAGRKEDPVDRLRDDVMTWEAARGPLILGEDDGALVLQTSAEGEVRLRGRLGIVPVRLSADLALVAEVAMRPVVLPDWSIEANLEGQAVISEAELYGLSIRRELQPGLDRSVRRSLNRLTERLADPEYLKARARKAWGDFCENPTEPRALRFLPTDVAATQPVIAQGVLRMSLVFSGAASVSDGQPISCPELPDMLVLLE